MDREAVMAAFAEILGTRLGSPCVFNVVGVGGIGKSRLLQELKQRSAETHRTATIDLQVPAMRQQEDALAVLRVELGRQGVRFDRFDIAYAVLWQRLHPHLRLSSKELPFVDESEALSQILDGAAGVPVFGTGVGLLRLLGKATSGRRQRQRIKSDDTLRQLDDLTNAELADAVTYLFAEDLRDGSDRPYIIFVDAYEALVPAPAPSGRALTQDVWLRDLIAQLDRGLVVMASREPLSWAAHDPAWTEAIHHQRVDGLPMPARLELLADGGITDHIARQAIATASQGLPFYLHLAVDTRTTARQAAAVSSEEILQRFLAHVSPDEIRTLELLSVARIFDYEIFQAVADAFDLPRHRVAWESLTAYSFVYPAGAHGRRLHQLMRAALHARLSQDTVRDVHASLRHVWDSRADGDHTAEDGVATRARAVREAAYCGLHAGDLDGAGILAYADQAMSHGGKQGVDGVTQDLRDFLDAGSGDPDLAQTALCLEAESAVLLGDAEAAIRLTPSIDWPLDCAPGARLALAGAHGRRIAGATGEAQRLFRQVWDHHSGPVRLRAGFCMADLDMCQGRFGDALSITQQILADAPDDDLVLRGDVVRLQHLGYRFGFDLDASARSLEVAAELYARAGAIIGQADVKTNRAELLAWTDPSRALDAAADAIDAQTELGAHHEIGKAFTALAIAQFRLGQHVPAAVSFQAAVEALERAHYRSGRARAELFRAFLHARTGDTASAVASARWAIAELVAAEVYPTLLMVAGHLLDVLGAADEHTATVTDRACTQIRPPNLLRYLDEQAHALVTAMLEDG
ncbi:aminoglycoside phosphotransferase family protein [Actinomadura livida]|uniref:Tetratricopeptide (TPR) repeat protein n=1 Tax=Actinomadura livida TaxID=79909 RepID=A0A7W7MYD2_9ACTN|nr:MULTISPECIES: aminoglycoside phosphotransferase family protein [Actinomadura]MBB4774695.1 tetratricopeptide (TPR) repeat protein [Actinomadura catellatispora]